MILSHAEILPQCKFSPSQKLEFGSVLAAHRLNFFRRTAACRIGATAGNTEVRIEPNCLGS
jgi:hypothetical protein